MQKAEPFIDPAVLQGGIRKFANWLKACGYESYDPYDVWGTRYGLTARRLYYQKKMIGFAMTAPVLLLEIMFPSYRVPLVKRERFATADAQIVLAFLNLHGAGFAPE